MLDLSVQFEETDRVSEPIPERADADEAHMVESRAGANHLTVSDCLKRNVLQTTILGGGVVRAVGWLRQKWVFTAVVIFPTILVAFYLWVIAAPQYISEAHFLVRGKAPGSGSTGGLASLLESGHGSSQDTYAVQDYMMSRDALRMLVQNVHIKDVFNRPYADFFAKFPSVFTRRDFESFYTYYKSHVKAQIDDETGISHLRVRTFSAKDSQVIAQTLLNFGEKLVNDINERQRDNTLHAAQAELDQSIRDLHDVEIQLAAYRYSNAIIDPMKQAVPMMGAKLSLETTLSMVEAEKKQLEITAPNSPLRKVYDQRIASIRAQMKNAQAQITGGNEKEVRGSLVPKLLGYDELEIKKTIIEKKIASEIAGLEMAKAQADRQMLYVTVVAAPNLPDYAEYPRDVVFLLITFFTCLGAYATGVLLVAGAREHALQ